MDILSPGVRDPLGGIENTAPAYKIKKDVEEEFNPPKTDSEREFMETFYDGVPPVADPTARKATRPAHPAAYLPSRNEEENSAYYQDSDGQRYHFSPATGLTRAPTLPSQPNMKRMKTVSSCSNRQSIAKACNEQLSNL